MKVLHVPSQIVYAKKIIPLPSTLVRDGKGIGGGIAPNKIKYKKLKKIFF